MTAWHAAIGSPPSPCDCNHPEPTRHYFHRQGHFIQTEGPTLLLPLVFAFHALLLCLSPCPAILCDKAEVSYFTQTRDPEGQTAFVIPLFYVCGKSVSETARKYLTEIPDPFRGPALAPKRDQNQIRRY